MPKKHYRKVLFLYLMVQKEDISMTKHKLEQNTGNKDTEMKYHNENGSSSSFHSILTDY